MSPKNMLRWLRTESIRIIPAVIYFCVAFNLIHFTTGLALPKGETRYFSALTVTFGGLIVGKMLILVNYLPFINAFPRKPLIYNILWKFVIYNIAIVLIWAADSMGHELYRSDSWLLQPEEWHTK